MYLMRVAPIKRGVFKEDLHYFTRENVPVGAIVSVPLRNKTISGFVLESISAKKAKIDIKSYPYQIRKVEDVKAKKFFSSSYMETIEKLKDYYMGTLGQVLFSMSPQEILKEADKLGEAPKEIKAKDKKLVWEEALYFQGSDEERLSFYKGKIREEFAKKASLFICVPTTQDIDRFMENLEKGIQKYTIPLHGKLPKKKLLLNWKKAMKEKHPILIIGTGHYLSIPREDIKTIIVEKESSPAYKAMTRPFIDFRKAAYIFAKIRKIHLVMGDIALRTESVYEKEAGNCHPSSSVKYRILSDTNTALVDMTKYKKQKPYVLISDDLKELIEKSIKNNERLFIFSHRKGLHTSVVCDDCGLALSCDRCSSPIVLYESKNMRFYMCHKCGATYPGNKLCGNCDSWRLSALGIGIDAIEKEVRKIAPRAKIFKIESETTTTYKKGMDITKKFMNAPGSICIGTEMAFFYLSEPIENTAIASIDSFFSIPDFRIKERALNILLRTKMLSKKNFLLQTRNMHWPLFDYVRSGNLINFYREEIEERSKLKYPPLYILIKVTRDGNHEKIEAELETLKEKIDGHMTLIYQAFTHKIRGKDRSHMLIKIKREKWPDQKLIKLLGSLPPEYLVNVEPTDLL